MSQVSPTRITCTFPLPNPTVLGPWDVYVMNADGQFASKIAAFTVTNPAPTVTGITPAGGTAGTLVSVTSLVGTNFVVGSPTTVWLAKTGQSNITATNITCNKPRRRSPARSRFPRPLPHWPGSGISS